MFAEATGTTISCSLGRWYGPMLSQSFLDVYGTNQVYGMLWYCFCLYFNSGKDCGTIMFAEATGTTIS
jgi:hypothetical protein